MADIGEPHLIGLQRCANKRLDIPVVRNEPGTVLHHLWLGCLHAIDRAAGQIAKLASAAIAPLRPRKNLRQCDGMQDPRRTRRYASSEHSRAAGI